MTTNVDDRQALEALELRIKTILPEEYQDSYEELQPAPMRSAGLKYGADGAVAWNEIWGSFCDLAMAGGPPHKGTLLEPATRAATDADADRYRYVTQEICRGVRMSTGRDAQPSPVPGWIRVACLDQAMAGWLLRAIVMENVAARAQGATLDLPAAPHFRLEKEIKNVVTVIAKTCHYWLGHMPREQRRAIATMFADLAEESPLITPDLSTDGVTTDAHQAVIPRMTEIVRMHTGLGASSHRYAGWLGVDCPSVRSAIWMMRALVVNNILSRREGQTLFVPVNPASDPDGEIVARTLARVHELARAKGVL
jgi:sirohydrochlorin cobaltochelatase